jgi:hypothetical protein
VTIVALAGLIASAAANAPAIARLAVLSALIVCLRLRKIETNRIRANVVPTGKRLISLKGVVAYVKLADSRTRKDQDHL